LRTKIKRLDNHKYKKTIKNRKKAYQIFKCYVCNKKINLRIFNPENKDNVFH